MHLSLPEDSAKYYRHLQHELFCRPVLFFQRHGIPDLHRKMHQNSSLNFVHLNPMQLKPMALDVPRPKLTLEVVATSTLMEVKHFFHYNNIENIILQTHLTSTCFICPAHSRANFPLLSHPLNLYSTDLSLMPQSMWSR